MHWVSPVDEEVATKQQTCPVVQSLASSQCRLLPLQEVPVPTQACGDVAEVPMTQQ